MKRSIPILVLSASFATLLSCGASFGTTGFEALGQVSETTRAQLQGSIVAAAQLSGLQELIFGLDINGPTSLDPIDCDEGGSTTSTFEIDNEPFDKLSSGDRVRSVFDGCTTGGTTYEGAVVFGFDLVIGDTETTDAWTASAILDVEDLVRAEPGSQRLTNGSLTAELEHLDNSDILIRLTGSGTTAISDEDGTRTRTIERLVFEWTYSKETGLTSLVVDAEFSTDAAEGVYMLTTVEPLIGEPFKIPNSGELLLTGANDSSLSMVVADGQLVRVRLDHDGDGVIDDVESLPWEDL